VGGTVTVGNSLTISSLPAISGTVTANLANVVTTDVWASMGQEAEVEKRKIDFKDFIVSSED
jgi:ornithine carbamoyltransferase